MKNTKTDNRRLIKILKILLIVIVAVFGEVIFLILTKKGNRQSKIKAVKIVDDLNNRQALVRADQENPIISSRNNDEGKINIVNVYGSHSEMGFQYGTAMKMQLGKALSLLKNYYIEEHGITYSQLSERADMFFQRYSYSYKLFIEGIAKSSGLSITDCKILNAMETLNSLVSKNGLGHCTFMFIPPKKSLTNTAFIGRNYDFPPPFDKLAEDLTVTILHEENKISTAIISMPGQIYCPSCINSEGLFIELNNGQPSGGFVVDYNRETLLIKLLEILQNSEDSFQLYNQLRATQSDYSLIINTATSNNSLSFEFSSVLGMKPYIPGSDEVYVSTNYFLNDTWSGIPTPTDNTTWLGVTRRENLLKLANAKPYHNITTLKEIMERRIEDGGALWNYTIYQIIFDQSNLDLYLRSISLNQYWEKISLQKYFNEQKSDKETGNSNDKILLYILLCLSGLSGLGVSWTLVCCQGCGSLISSGLIVSATKMGFFNKRSEKPYEIIQRFDDAEEDRRSKNRKGGGR